MSAKKEKTFEESMNRLDEIVSELEANEKPLDETITLFEEGLGLVKSCEKQLKSFEDKIEQLTKESTDEDDN